MRITFGAIVAALIGTGCVTTLAEVPTSDKNVLVVEGIGTRARVAQKCLSRDTIKQLLASDIPDGVKKQSCYWVALISTDSSDISRAVSSFIRAKDEFDDKTSRLVAPSGPKLGNERAAGADKAAAAEVATSLVSFAATNEPAEVIADYARNIPEEQKADVKRILLEYRAGVTNAEVATRLDAVLAP